MDKCCNCYRCYISKLKRLNTRYWIYMACKSNVYSRQRKLYHFFIYYNSTLWHTNGPDIICCYKQYCNC